VLLSGGLDSATCLALAQQQGFEPVALSFDYGQRHNAELAAARRIAEAFAVRDHRVLRLDLGNYWRLRTDRQLPLPYPPKLVKVFQLPMCPARNTVFLSFALGSSGSHRRRCHLSLGLMLWIIPVIPDCRPEFIDGFRAPWPIWRPRPA
jgi:7-cyano-7-deazaguanine synthase